MVDLTKLPDQLIELQDKTLEAAASVADFVADEYHHSMHSSAETCRLISVAQEIASKIRQLKEGGK